MSDMRLIVAGAGGRMGRTLVEAISETEGAVLVGAVEAPGSAVIGRDAGELAGLGTNGILVSPRIEPLLAEADGILDFTIPGGDRGPRRSRGAAAASFTSSAPPASRPSTRASSLPPAAARGSSSPAI